MGIFSTVAIAQPQAVSVGILCHGIHFNTHCGFITKVMFRPKHPWARFLKCAEEDQKLNFPIRNCQLENFHTSVPSGSGGAMPSMPGTTPNGSRLQGSTGAISGASWTGLACSTSSSSETSGSSSAAGIAS